MSDHEQADPPTQNLENEEALENSPENIQALEEEIIKLAEDDLKAPEEDQICPGENPDQENPFELANAPQREESPEESEVNVLKKYQQTLQELKEEISRLNKRIEIKSSQEIPDPSDEALFRIRTLARLTKAESKRLQAEAEKYAESNAQLSESIENLKDQSASKPASNEKIATLSQKLKDLEKEHAELTKSHEVSLRDLEKVLQPDVSQKFVNEFYVNVQKRVDSLELENNSLSQLVKKSSIEVSKLKEKIENSNIRKKANDEVRTKLQKLEETYENFLVTDGRLKNGIKESLEELSFYGGKQENQHDMDSAKNILKDMKDQVIALELEQERLEFVLQEKKNFFRAKQIYGLQRSKTSNKLRSDMELLGLVLVEKEQLISKMRREIEEINIKTNKVQIDIKEIQDRKNNFN